MGWLPRACQRLRTTGFVPSPHSLKGRLSREPPCQRNHPHLGANFNNKEPLRKTGVGAPARTHTALNDCWKIAHAELAANAALLQG